MYTYSIFLNRRHAFLNMYLIITTQLPNIHTFVGFRKKKTFSVSAYKKFVESELVE